MPRVVSMEITLLFFGQEDIRTWPGKKNDTSIVVFAGYLTFFL